MQNISIILRGLAWLFMVAAFPLAFLISVVQYALVFSISKTCSHSFLSSAFLPLVTDKALDCLDYKSQFNKCNILECNLPLVTMSNMNFSYVDSLEMCIKIYKLAMN